MTKLKSPLHSLGASGSIANALSFATKLKTKIVRKKPKPTDARSDLQLSWRHMYQKAVALWHALSTAEKQQWESSARRKHMTGFAYFMSQCLRPNPGIYLPLQGGTMQGNIDMASYKITTLPSPIADTEPTRLTELNAHIAILDAHHTPPLADIKVGDNYVPLGWRLAAPGARVANYHYYLPLYIPRTMTFDRIGINVTIAASAGKSALLGFYHHTNGRPAALKLDAGEVAIDSVALHRASIDLQLTPGDWWTFCVLEEACTLHKQEASYSFPGIPAPISNTLGYIDNLAYPSPPVCPDPSPIIDANLSTYGQPMIHLRVKSIP